MTYSLLGRASRFPRRVTFTPNGGPPHEGVVWIGWRDIIVTGVARLFDLFYILVPDEKQEYNRTTTGTIS
jgi:hypothetical protein